MAGLLAERQERGLIDAINAGYGLNSGKVFTIRGPSGDKITGCIKAEKYEGRSAAGTEPYTDVIITTKKGLINISNKGTSAPSIAGGGLKGLELALPGFTKRFLDAALQKYIQMGFTEGMAGLPDMYGKVSDNLKEQIVVGNAAMGGPINYMYIGPMDVKYNFSPGTVRVNGKFYDAVKYAKKNDLFLRLRKRRVDQPFAPNETDRQGLPLIMGKSPSRGDKGRRIVTVAKPPGNAVIVEF
jgi:hypothetical protein|tara:strand:+ start:52 stop:774 length:723 start_codon:yes stop_codon:yes gene_type:complete